MSTLFGDSIWGAPLWGGAPVTAESITPVRKICLTAASGWQVQLTAAAGCSVAKTKDIKGLIIGAHLRVLLDVTALVTGKTIVSADFYVKAKLKDADASALITKNITAALTAQGLVTDVGTDTTAQVYFDMSNTETGALKAGKDYHYFIRLTYSDGVLDVPIHGAITFELA